MKHSVCFMFFFSESICFSKCWKLAECAAVLSHWFFFHFCPATGKQWHKVFLNIQELQMFIHGQNWSTHLFDSHTASVLISNICLSPVARPLVSYSCDIIICIRVGGKINQECPSTLRQDCTTKRKISFSFAQALKIADWTSSNTSVLHEQCHAWPGCDSSSSDPEMIK